MHRSYGLQHLRHKRPTFAFTPESGYTLGFAQRIAHNGSHGETGAFRTGPLSLPSTRTARSRTSPGRVSERRTLPLWNLGREVLSKNAESLRDSDALMRVAVPKASRPRWAACFFCFCRNCGLYALHSELSVRAKQGWYHYPRRALHAAEMPDGRLSKRFICRFLASPIYICESSRRALPISASIQIACCWISRGHIACPWLIQA